MRCLVVTSSRSDLNFVYPLAEALAKAGIATELLPVTGQRDPAQSPLPLLKRQEPLRGLSVLEPLVAEESPSRAPSMPLELARTCAVMGGLCAQFGALLETRTQSYQGYQGYYDYIVLPGDRFEVAALGLAATLFPIKLVHIGGGVQTLGAVDERYRNALSRLAHLHFVTSAMSRARLLRLGESARTIFVTGTFGLWAQACRAQACRVPGAWAEVASRFGLPPTPPLLVCLHPETADGRFEQAEHQARLLCQVLARFLARSPGASLPLVFTHPNSDPGSPPILDVFQNFVTECHQLHPGSAFLVPTFGADWPNLLAHARALIGNSSSGIIEAASFRLPVLNIGSRQAGRETARNVCHAPFESEAIRCGLDTVLSASFRAGLVDLENPYAPPDGETIALRALHACRHWGTVKAPVWVEGEENGERKASPPDAADSYFGMLV